MKLVWTEPAVSDLQEIHRYIARDSESYAAHFIENILKLAERLVAFPRLGRVVPEEGSEGIRELIVSSYRVIYRIAAERIEILTVLHGSRDLNSLQKKPWD
jgi:addiction module RelE/StbE family toxin